MPWLTSLEAGCFVVWFFDSEAIWLPIPIIQTDDRNRCHADGEPAFKLPEEELYFWHGTLLPEKWGKIRSEQWESKWLLEEKNAELRRALIEGIGYEKILVELGSEKIHSQGSMELHRITKNVDVEPINLLKVECPSTGSFYTLRVPPTFKNCEAARRWTLGDEALELVRET